MKCLLLISAAYLALSFNAAAFDGNEISGGGSGSAAEFADLGYNAAKTIQKLKDFPVPSDTFKSTVQSTHVEFVDETLRDMSGLEVDALNFPTESLIKVNLQRWKGLFFSPEKKFQLVTHEFLGILRVDDSGYHVSHLILDGGIRIHSVNCTYPVADGYQGTIDWYQIDSTGSGQADLIEAKFALRSTKDENFDESSPVVIGISSRDGKQLGYSLSWSLWLGPSSMAFMTLEEVKNPGDFSENVYVNTGFDPSSGIPNFRESGTLACHVVGSLPHGNEN